MNCNIPLSASADIWKIITIITCSSRSSKCTRRWRGGGTVLTSSQSCFFFAPNFYLLKKYKTQIRYMNNLPNDKTNKMKVNSSYVINNDPLRQPQQAEIFPSLVGTDRPANTMSRCHKCSHMVVSIWEISFISFFVSVSGTFLIFRMGTFQVCSKSLMSLCVISL